MIEFVCPNDRCGHTWAETDDADQVSCPSCGTQVSFSEAGRTVGYTPGNEPEPESPEPRADKAPHTKIGPYEIHDVLGSGTFGTVCRGFDTRLKRFVAIKVLKSDWTAHPQIVDRFLREARSAANLSHPNIVPVYDTGVFGSEYYIATAFIDGSSLDKKLRTFSGDFRRSAALVRDLARALAYAHQQQVVHRDIKPANVMLSRAGQPLVMDFGLARWKSELVEPVDELPADVKDRTLTMANQVLGTPAYMAPEQALAEQSRIGPASDQYSLGVVLYELLTNRIPFHEAHGQILARLRDPQARFPSPRDRNSLVPQDLDAICLKALAWHPEQRYADCDALARDLDRWLEGRPVDARPLSRREQFQLWCRREPVVATLTLGVMVAITVGAVSSALLAWHASDRAGAAEIALENETSALRQARTQQAAAIAAQKLAEQERTRADEKTRDAVAAQKQASERADYAEQLAYVANLQLIQQAWDRGAIAELKTRLALHQPRPGTADRRGFEWFYWDRLMRICPGARNVHPANSNVAHLLPIPKSDLVLVVESTQNNSALSLRQLVSHEGREQLEHVRSTPLLSGAASLCFSPRGDLVATRDNRDSVHLWTFPDLKLVRSLVVGHHFSRSRILIDSTGSKLYVLNARVGNERYSLRRFDLVSGEPDWELKELDLLKHLLSSLQSLELSPDGSHALAAGPLNTATWWNVHTKTLERSIRFPNPATRFHSCRLSADGQRAIGLGIDGQIVVWNLATGGHELVLTGDANLGSREIRLDRSGKLACVGNDYELSQIWNLQTGELVNARWGCALPPEQVRTDQPRMNGPLLVSQDRLWEPGYDPLGTTITVASEAPGPPAAANLAIAFHPKSGLCAVGGRFDTVSLLDTRTWKVVDRLTVDDPTHRFSISRMTFDAQGRGLLAAASRGRAAHWKLGTPVGSLLNCDFHAETLDVQFLPDAESCVVSSESRQIQLWNLRRNEVTGEFHGHTSYSYEWAKEQGLSGDRLKQASTPPIRREFDSNSLVGHSSIEGMVTGLAVHPDGRRLVSVCGDGTVRMWDLKTQQELLRHHEKTGPFHCVEFDRTGSRLLLGHSQGRIEIRDPGTLELLSTLTGHEAIVLDLELSPDNRRLISCSSDRTVRFWDLTTNQPVLRLDCWNSVNDPFGIIERLAMHPSGTLLAGTSLVVPKLIRCWQSDGPASPPQIEIVP